MRSSLMILVLACAGLSVSCRPDDFAMEAAYSKVHSDSGITGPSYTEIVSQLENAAANSQSFAEVKTYGRSGGGLPLTAIKIAAPGVTPQKAVVITGAIHGDEFLDIAHKLPQWFLDNRQSGATNAFLSSGGAIYVAPILNPDGYQARRRENQQGRDLNRDFPLKRQNFAGNRQTEVAQLTEFLKQETTSQNMQIAFTLDYHCCQGSLIYPWGYSQNAKLDPAMETLHQRLARTMLTEFTGYKSGRVWDLLRYTALGGSTDYYHEEYNAKAFTFEGAYQREAQQFDKHTRMWTNILQELTGDGDVPPGPTTPPQSQAMFFALGANSDQIGVSTAALDVQRMTLCEGTIEVCKTATPLLTLTDSSQKDGIKIFRGPLATVPNAEKIYTVLTYGSANQPTAYRSFQFRGH